MLPFGGQGSNQAIEDGGALGFLFEGIERPGEISRRLEMFELVRRTRASRAQILSRVRVGKEQEIHHGLLKYADPPGSGMTAQPCHKTLLMIIAGVPSTFSERIEHDYGFAFLGTILPID